MEFWGSGALADRAQNDIVLSADLHERSNAFGQVRLSETVILIWGRMYGTVRYGIITSRGEAKKKKKKGKGKEGNGAIVLMNGYPHTTDRIHLSRYHTTSVLGCYYGLRNTNHYWIGFSTRPYASQGQLDTVLRARFAP